MATPIPAVPHFASRNRGRSAPIPTFPHFKGGNRGRSNGTRVEGAFWGREEVLPYQFGGGIRVFLFKRIREVDSSEAGRQVFIVKETDAFDLALKVRDDGVGHGGDAILFAPSTR